MAVVSEGRAALVLFRSSGPPATLLAAEGVGGLSASSVAGQGRPPPGCPSGDGRIETVLRLGGVVGQYERSTDPGGGL